MNTTHPNNEKGLQSTKGKPGMCVVVAKRHGYLCALTCHGWVSANHHIYVLCILRPLQVEYHVSSTVCKHVHFLRSQRTHSMAPASLSQRIALSVSARGGEPSGGEEALVSAVCTRAKLPRGSKFEAAEICSHMCGALTPIVA